jgi:outer membrane protein assembly factor BamA
MKTPLQRVCVRRSFASLLAFLVALAFLIARSSSVAAEAQAQTSSTSSPMPPSAYKLIAVNVSGSKRYTSQEVAAAGGLPVGTIAHEEDFKKAARQLGESGAFGSVAYTFTYSAAGTKLAFQVTDAAKFIPARFTDFVWFTDEDLLRKLHERIPLYDGTLPVSGRMTGEVSDVLQAMLVENGIPGVVEYHTVNGADGHPAAIEYNVAGVSIRIHQVEFVGAGPDELPLLQAAAKKLIDREYSRAYMANFIEHGILPILHDRGYLKASCARGEPKIVKVPPPELFENRQPPTFVQVTFPVTPGIPYKLTGWQWSGNKEISTAELQPLIHAKTGEPASTLKLEDDLRTAQALYGSRGYVTATIKADAEFDDAAGTVAYQLTVTEGAVYHMGDLEFRGIDNNLTARLRSAWKLRPGDVYDASYLKEFLPLARKLLPATMDWEVTPHVTALARDKTVDVDLQYTAKAPQ